MDSIESPVMASGAPGAVERHERRGSVSAQAPLVRLGPIPSGRGAFCRGTHLLLPQAGQHLQHQPSSGTPPGLPGKNDYRHLQVVGAFHPRPILIRMRSQPGVTITESQFPKSWAKLKQKTQGKHSTFGRTFPPICKTQEKN